MQSSIAAEAQLGGRDLDEQVRAAPPRRGSAAPARRSPRGRTRASGRPRATPSRRARRALPDRAQQVTGGADVVHGEGEEDLGRLVHARRDLAQLDVVRIALRQRLLEDGRVGGDADDGVLLDQAGELARSRASRARASRSRRSRHVRSAGATSMRSSSLLSPDAGEHARGRGRDRLRGEPELLEDPLVRRRGAEAVDAERDTRAARSSAPSRT